MTAAKRWALAIGGLLVGNLAATSVLLGFAHGDTERRVVPDYYRQAAAWDREEAAQEASRALGWRATVSLGDAIELAIVDRGGAPVRGARVVVHGHPRGRLDVGLGGVVLDEVAPGRYRAASTVKASGLWDVQINAARAGAAFVDDQVVAAEAP